MRTTSESAPRAVASKASEPVPRAVASEPFAKDLIDGKSLASARGADSSAQVEIFSHPPVIHETFSRSAPHIDSDDEQV